jgi:hypothetical protein
MEASNYKIGEFIGKSEATVRNLRKDSVEVYEKILDAYLLIQEKGEVMAKKKLIAAVNIKGTSKNPMNFVQSAK